jgi:large subunit ribosomal protein L1
MGKRSKRMKDILAKVDVTKEYTIEQAVEILKNCPKAKFDETFDIALKLGVDPKKSDQQVRGTVSLPHGTGKNLRVIVFAQGDKVQEALKAGAEHAGSDELFEKVKAGWTDFDAVIATPDMMREVGKLGKVLGPRGLMPTPKGGTVTTDVATALKEIKAGKIEFKLDKNGVLAAGIGKLSFAKEALVENLRTLIVAVLRAKPATAKGQYVQSFAVSSTMGPGLKIDFREIPTT